jgi:dTDP-4-amino-4,6-dideoxygalactose transaminase
MIPVLFPHLQLSDLISFFQIGKKIDGEFENQLNKKFNSKFCVTFSSGRAGLYNILKANNIQNKSILVTAYTCCVVSEAISQSGNTAKFIDTKEGSFNADILKNNISKYHSNLGAIIVTNLYGITSFSDIEILDIDKNILLILDDALSPAHLFDVPNTTFDYSFISCAVRKPFSCLGGGVVFSNNEKKYSVLKDYVLKTRKKIKIKKLVAQFILSFSFFFAFKPIIYSLTSLIRRKTNLLNSFFNEKYNDIYKSKPEYYLDMCDFQKRIGKNQLNKINFLTDRRKEIGNLYFKLFSFSYPLVKQYWIIDTAYSHIPFLHPNRNELQEYLLKNGIETETYFDYIIPELKQYKNDDKFPRAKYLSENIINLPINIKLSNKTISKIVTLVKKFDICIKHNNRKNLI